MLGAEQQVSLGAVGGVAQLEACEAGGMGDELPAADGLAVGHPERDIDLQGLAARCGTVGLRGGLGDAVGLRNERRDGQRERQHHQDDDSSSHLENPEIVLPPA